MPPPPEDSPHHALLPQLGQPVEDLRECRSGGRVCVGGEGGDQTKRYVGRGVHALRAMAWGACVQGGDHQQANGLRGRRPARGVSTAVQVEEVALQADTHEQQERKRNLTAGQRWGMLRSLITPSPPPHTPTHLGDLVGQHHTQHPFEELPCPPPARSSPPTPPPLDLPVPPPPPTWLPGLPTSTAPPASSIPPGCAGGTWAGGHPAGRRGEWGL